MFSIIRLARSGYRHQNRHTIAVFPVVLSSFVIANAPLFDDGKGAFKLGFIRFHDIKINT